MIEKNKAKIKKSKMKNDLNDSSKAIEDITSVRPKSFADIIGRKSEKKTILMMVNSAKTRQESLDHILFYGPPGLGKTTFATAIATEMGASIRVTSGPALDKQGDLAAILTNLRAQDILFIDEIHRLSRSIEEILYPAMEDGVLDIVVGKGPSAKSIRIKLKPFTLIGATTQIGKISSPLRDRFGLVMRLDYFDQEDIVQILKRASGIWDIDIDTDALMSIATRSRGTARIALRLLKRVRDFALSIDNEESSTINTDTVNETFKLLDIDEFGLEQIDRDMLVVMYKHFNGGPVGVSTLASAISEDVSTVTDVYEPYLMKLGLLKRTSRGRILTEKGINYVETIL